MMRSASSVETSSIEAEAGFGCSVRSPSNMFGIGLFQPSIAIFKEVRYFLTRRLPSAEALLLVESGSRDILERVIPGLRETWGPEVAIDLVTCYAKLPRGLD